MLYRLPEIDDEEEFTAFLRENYENGEIAFASRIGIESRSYSEWVEKIHYNSTAGEEPWGRSLFCLCFVEKRLVGILFVRYELTEELSMEYGDIGYRVRPSERHKGYATAMLKHGLSVCKEKGKNRVILGCYKDNLASAATIKKNGGVLICEKENPLTAKVSQYYSIEL